MKANRRRVLRCLLLSAGASLLAAPSALAAPKLALEVRHLNLYGQLAEECPGGRASLEPLCGVDPYSARLGSSEAQDLQLGQEAFDRESGFNEYTITAKNVGETAVEEGATVTVTDQLPAGLRLADGEPGARLLLENPGWSCRPELDATAVTCAKKPPSALSAGASYPPITLKGVYVEPQAEASVIDRASAYARQPGGAAIEGASTTPAQGETKIVTVPFGLEPGLSSQHDARSVNAGQEALEEETQAGGHPLALETNIYFHSVAADLGYGVRLNAVPGGPQELEPGPKEVQVELPAGLVGDVQNAAHCPLGVFANEGIVACPKGSAVGYTQVRTSGEYPPEHGALPPLAGGRPAIIYNLTPTGGHPAEFGFRVILGGGGQANGSIPVVLYAKVRSDRDYGVTTGSEASGSLLGARVTFCSYGANPALKQGQPEKLECLPPHAGEHPSKPLLTNPVQCSTELATSLMADPWREPSHVIFESKPFHLPSMTGCSALSFAPRVEVGPSAAAQGGTHLADSPSAIDVTLNNEERKEEGKSVNAGPNPSCEEVKGAVVCPPITPELKTLRMRMPPGLTISPPGADGLQVCTNEQFGLGTEFGTQKHPLPAGQAPTEPAGEAHCPLASQIGTVEVFTPLLAEEPPGTAPLRGALYTAQPECSPCTREDTQDGRAFRLFLQLQDRHAGVTVRLEGTAQINGEGRLETVFEDQPQTPFSKLVVHLKGGPRASLATPQTCGSEQTESDLVPWSTPETPNATPSFPFAAQGCEAKFSPALNAGSELPAAGQYTPFSLTLTRQDREGDPASLQVSMPPGLTARLASVPSRCAEAQANAGTCSPESQLGTVTAGVGSGSRPFFQQGKVYLTGALAAYPGDPFGLSIVIPAVAGPYNLGQVVVTSGIAIDESTAAVTVNSASLPQEIDGIPLRLKAIHVQIDRERFELNPTNCAAQTLTAQLASTQGQTATPSAPFDVGGCGALAFAPAFSAATEAKTSRKEGASLTTSIVVHGKEAGAHREGEANLKRVDVQLPKALPSELPTLQKACTQAQFLATNPHGRACPAAAFVGTATARSPLLSVPLTGRAILVARGAEFPDLDFMLEAEGIRIDVIGHTQIKGGITYSHFEALPDVPIESFEASFPRSPNPLLGANGNFCKQKLVMPTTLEAQDGAKLTQETTISVSGCPPPTHRLTRARKLERALKACRKQHRGHKQPRQRCERKARKRFGPKRKQKSKRARAARHAGASALTHALSSAAARSGTALSAVALSSAAASGASSTAAPSSAAGSSSEGCPNEALRAESNIDPATGRPYSQGLPECRAYELVSPVEKGGQNAVPRENTRDEEGFPVSPSGEAVGFFSEGDFAEPEGWAFRATDYMNPYLARRGAGGWRTKSTYAPANLITTPELYGMLGDFSPDLRSAQASCGEAPDAGYACARRAGEGAWERAGPYFGVHGEAIHEFGYSYLGASSDLSRLFVQPKGMSLLEADKVGESSSGKTGDALADPHDIYEMDLQGETPALRLVNVNNEGAVLTGGLEEEESSLIIEPPEIGGPNTDYHAISEDGERVFFTAVPPGGQPTLYARVAARETVTLSAPQGCEPGEARCEAKQARPVRFRGASANGARVFFTSEQMLLPPLETGQKATVNLWEYDFEAPPGQRLTMLSRGGPGDPAPGQEAEVKGVVASSRDGSHVYFVAGGVLTTLPNSLGQAAARDADNLYAIDTETGVIKFVARLAAGDEMLWGEASGEKRIGLTNTEDYAQSTPDGRYLAFSAFANLDPEEDHNGCVSGSEACSARAAYRYDFETGRLTWISRPAKGFASARPEGFSAVIAPLPIHLLGAYANIDDWNRALSETGEDVIFTSEERLQAQDESAQRQAESARQCEESGRTECVREVPHTGSPGHALCDKANQRECAPPQVYLWHCASACPNPESEGEVHLISDGQSPYGVDVSSDGLPSWPAMSASGHDIFFFTTTALVPQDTDELQDLYDARVEGGVALPAQPSSCEGEACQGAPALAPQFGPVGSSLFTGGHNLAARAPALASSHRAATRKAQRREPAHRRRARRHGRRAHARKRR